MKLTDDFKRKVIISLIELRQNYGGSDSAFAKQQGINGSVFSRLKNGEIEGLLKETQWLNLGRSLNVGNDGSASNKAYTEVFQAIENDIIFCQEYSKSMQFVDIPDIGKSFTALYLSKTRKNCFYIDASQCRTQTLFIRALAQVVGVDNTGTIASIKANTKYYLRMLHKPIVLIDEAGDLEYKAEMELKEYWNATEGVCGWYKIGSDGLEEKNRKAIANKKVGAREMYSRFGNTFTSVVPKDKNERVRFLKKLLVDYLSVNMKDKSQINNIARRALVESEGQYSVLRRAKTLLALNEA